VLLRAAWCSSVDATATAAAAITAAAADITSAQRQICFQPEAAAAARGDWSRSGTRR